ncbi:MAG: leucine-rich repeat domain-containing protein [Clostridia bacterium]|nr:leucine-rich repeat domain-containing protein [Clostridia bacterium]
MKLLKKAVALFIIACLATALLTGCIDAKAYEGSDESLFNFVLLEDGTYSVCAKDVNDLPESVSVPKTYNEADVTVIAENAFKGASIKEVRIPGTIKTISNSAFYGCVDLTTVYFYKGVEEIGAGAFYGCKGIKQLNLPSSLKVIGDSAFCNVSITKLTLTEKVETVGNLAFAYCTELNKVYISHSVSSLASNAFVGSSSELEFEISASNAYYKLDENGKPVAR